MITNCAVCNKVCLVPETKEDEQHPLKTLYWSYEDNGNVRPYCGPECSLTDYQEKRENERK